MPKRSLYPRLRTHVRKGAGGQIWTSWWYDGRPDGEPDQPLGNDYAEALKRWKELYEHKPRIAGTLKEAFERWEKEVLPGYENAGTKRNYAAHLKALAPVFGRATWDSIEFVHLKQYLKKRTAKTQGNREMALLSLVWNWARGEGLTKLPYPAAGLEKSKWKNKETGREFAVTDALFAAVYGEADSVLQQTMDLATATGLRLTDCREILLPTGDELSISASKTRKRATFSVTASPVLSRLCEQRSAISATHLMLLTTPSGKPVTAQMLRSRWDKAREKAASRPENAAIADELRAMYLRDMRKRAADLAGDLSEASKLLQHSSEALTERSYRTKATKLRPVR